jgi:hypothetical protein
MRQFGPHVRLTENMFDSLRESQLLAGMSAAQHDERVATARRILLAGRLCQLRMAAVDDAERFQWCIDNWEAVAAEVGAELGISRGRASAQMNYGVELLERLPRLGATFAAGQIEFRAIAAVVFRTGLITDAEILTRIDDALSRRARAWNALSRKRLADAIDWLVAELDPAALRSARPAEQDRHIEFGPARDGMVEFWGATCAPPTPRPSNAPSTACPAPYAPPTRARNGSAAPTPWRPWPAPPPPCRASAASPTAPPPTPHPHQRWSFI